jgi:hypothetical protein
MAFGKLGAMGRGMGHLGALGSAGIRLDAVATFGDSTDAMSGASNPATTGWLAHLANDAYPTPWSSYGGGAAGEDSAQMLAHVLAYAPKNKILILMDRPNTGELAADWIENTKAACNAWRGPCLVVPPAQDAPSTSIQNITDVQGLLLSDPFFVGKTFDSTMQAAYLAAVNNANTRSDGTHFNDLGQAIQAFYISAFFRTTGVRRQWPTAAAVISRFSADPGALRDAYVNSLVERVTGCGVWANLDYLRICAAHDEQANTIDWINGTYTATKVGTVTFTADAGRTGNGTTGYYTSGFNPGTASSPKFVQNSAHLMCYPTSSVAESKEDIGATNSFIRTLNADNSSSGRMNSAGTTTVLTGQSTAIRSFILTGDATNIYTYTAGGLGSTNARTSQAVANSQVLEGSGPISAFATKRQGAFSAGALLSATQIRAYDYALHAWMRAVGLDI